MPANPCKERAMRDGRIRLVLAGVLCVGLLALSIGEASLLAPGAAPREAADNPQGARAGAKAGGPAADAAKGEKLTLDRIFPEKSFFGPGARSMTFSRDGRFAAFLYRPYAERRHGNDLYVHDTVTGDTRRITSVGRMAQYQAEARKVQEDREKKAKKAGVSLSLLAREQYQAMRWTEGLIVGDWDGQATGGGAAIAPGACEVEFNERAAGGFAGQVRIGLVRLLLKSVEVNEAAATVKGKIDDEALKVKGELSLTLAGGELRGDLKLTQPEEALTLTLTRRAPAEPDKAKTGPLGVLGAIGERLTLADVVLADDAEINDDKDGTPVKERAPRYGGVSSIEWSPTKHEMLLLAEGEIFLLTIDPTEWETPMTPPKLGAPVEGPPPAKEEAPDPGAPGDKPEDDEQKEDGAQEEKAEKDDKVVEEDKADAQPEGEKPAADAKPKSTTPKKPSLAPVTPYRGELTRLTRTRERETDVQYLPDGSGYTYLRSGALLRVSFGDHQIMQLDPELKDGERMVGYRISPDKRRLVFLANRGQTTGSRARQVTIVNYRDRFARAQDVSRHMPDDPWPESYTSVYLYDLRGHEKEDGKLERVFTRRVNGPRDVMRVPEWSPDSSLVAFAAYDQQTGHMKILEAGFKTEKKPGEPAKATEPPSTPPADQGEDGAKNDDTQQDAPQTEEKKEEEPEFKIENARVVYQFLHHGGPNTPGLVQPQYLPDSRRMVFITELSGFRQLHMLEPRYEQLTQVTSGKFELFPFYISKDNTTLFATSSEGDPNQEHVIKIDLQTLEATRLTSAPGVYREAAVRDDGSLVLAMHVDFGAPGELVMVRPGAEPTQTALTDSHPEEAHKLTKALPEYFTYENRHGQTIHGHMFKPADWTPADKRPLLIYVYGGPLQSFNKMATRGSYSAPSYFFARYMAENHGYVAVTIDPRGASGYGAVFEKANFEQVGKPQTEDLVDGARWLVKHHGVDEKRMAMHGWSFGGFQTQMVMYTEPDVFAAGIAGAGPTEWHNYNSWYSTGTIGSNQPGKTDLEKYSLLPLAKNLKGKLLLVHGVEDSNVLYQDTVRVYRELLKANKEVNVELFIDPTGGHGLGGDVKTIGRYRKYEDFLLRTIGKGEATKATEANPEGEAARPEGEAKPDGGEAKTP
jgi:dipeptidyl-peptidase-4